MYKLRQAGDRKTQRGKRKTYQEPDGDTEKVIQMPATKKLQNTFKKVLTRGFESGILDKLAKRKASGAKAQRTLKTA